MSTYKGFSTVQLRKPIRSKFDLSHEKRLTTRMGKLTPVFVSETMPNDTFRVSTEVMLRLAPLIAPVMHRINLFVHFFFVPNRLLWKEWADNNVSNAGFITGGRLGTETPPVPPNFKVLDLTALGFDLLDKGSVYDYLGGNPITDASGVGYGARTLDLMPFAAYYKVWYDFYRDRNYVGDNDFLPMASGQIVDINEARAITAIRYRDYQKDYFTSALPWTQRGAEVLMPLSGSGVVSYLKPTIMRKVSDDLPIVGPNTMEADAAGHLQGVTGGVEVYPDNISSVDITTSDVSINDLRLSIRLQEWLERNALAGSRYTESIWAHFNRRTSDGRLQRAEYLGGGKVVVKINEVLTTAFSEDATPETVPPANMAGYSMTLGESNQFTYNCEEHGFVLGIMSVMPNTSYMQGIPRMFIGRNSFLDYPWPSFAHLGEQEVKKYELFADTTNFTENRASQPVFGYQSRYADWKYIPSSSHGDFRTSLDFWHLTRKFLSSPVLGDTFCTFEDALQDRIFAVSGVDTLWCYIYNNCSVIRSLPYYGTPLL